MNCRRRSCRGERACGGGGGEGVRRDRREPCARRTPPPPPPRRGGTTRTTNDGGAVVFACARANCPRKAGGVIACVRKCVFGLGRRINVDGRDYDGRPSPSPARPERISARAHTRQRSCPPPPLAPSPPASGSSRLTVSGLLAFYTLFSGSAKAQKSPTNYCYFTCTVLPPQGEKKPARPPPPQGRNVQKTSDALSYDPHVFHPKSKTFVLRFSRSEHRITVGRRRRHRRAYGTNDHARPTLDDRRRQYPLQRRDGPHQAARPPSTTTTTTTTRRRNVVSRPQQRRPSAVRGGFARSFYVGPAAAM